MSKKEDPLESLGGLSKQELVSFILHLEKEGRIFSYEIQDILKSKEIYLPISIFNNKELSSLETITKYLKENLNLSYHEIALILNRDDRTIWSTYNKAIKKRKSSLKAEPSEYHIPLSIPSNRKLAVLQSIVIYLKDHYNLSYHQIASLLRRNDRTIWTTYQIAKKRLSNV